MIGRAAIVIAALAAAFLPLPAQLIERWYSRAWYSRFQSVVTPAANLVPLALFDIAVAVAVVAALIYLWRQRPLRVASILGSLMVVAAALYLVFLFTWGLNYRRVRMEEKVAFDSSRISRVAAVRLANEAVTRINATYVPAHAMRFDVASLETAFASVQHALGAPRTPPVGIAKRSLLGWYFRKAAIDGMTDPFFLEIIVNPDVLEIERPWVFAHEWAHLAGYAHESEANFVAWLACARGDALTRYSGALATYEYAVRALPREVRRMLIPLDGGPREDLRAIAARYQRSSPTVRNAARDAYDSYLRANRVDEGIESYGAVLRLMLATELDAQGNPKLRTPSR